MAIARAARCIYVGLFGLAILSACGPFVSEQRLAFNAPKPPTCAIEMVKTEITDLAPGGPWEHVGSIIIQYYKNLDPLSEKVLATVRPRACQMGGEAITIMQATSIVNRGTAITYAVIIPRVKPAAD